MWRRLRSLVALITALALLFAMAPPGAVAAEAPLTDAEAITILKTYDIVRGDQSGDLRLGDKLDRASAAAIFVRVMGYEEMAKTMKDSVPFADAKGHWGAGEIAMANVLGLMKGDGAGNFRPNSDITYVEVLTVLLRIVKQEPAGTWNASTIMTKAGQLGLVPQGAEASVPALRGKIFWSLATAASQIPLPNGQTALQLYRDAIAPVLTLDRTEIITRDASTVVSGTASGASRVLVGGKPATFSAATGRFTYTAQLVVGTNNLNVVAYDYAGNQATAVLRADRQAGASRLDVVGPTLIRPGSRNPLKVTAYDNAGNTVPLDGLQASVSGGLATFDTATTTLVAGTALGRGTLTLQLGTVTKTFAFEVTNNVEQPAKLQVIVNDGRAPAPGKDTTVKVQVLDQNDRLVANDYFRTITLTADDLTGLSVVTRTATTQAGVATFTIRSTSEGTGSLTAKSTELPDATVPVQVLSSPRIALYTSNTVLSADGATSTFIRARLQDDEGRPVVNSGTADIILSLAVSGTDSDLTDSSLVIRRNTSEAGSGYDGALKVGIQPGTAVISGSVASGTRYPVQNLYLPISGNLPGAQLQITGPTAMPKPGGTPAPITVKVLNSNGAAVTTGSYAFQFTVTTSNNEEIVNGLPEGVNLYFQNTAYKPVPGAGTSSVVGRTNSGTATIYLTYNKSGTVTLTPKLVGPTDEAYNPTGGFAPAAASSEMTAVPLKVTFAGDPVGIVLTADSDLGTDKPGGTIGVTDRSMLVRATVVDKWGTKVPSYSGAITLTRSTVGTGVTRFSGTSPTTARLNAPLGEAEFTVQSSGTAGFDVWTATASGLTGADITLSVRRTVPDTPDIAVIRGSQSEAVYPSIGYVAPNAQYMEIQLFGQETPNAGETHNWVTAKVYQKGKSAPILSGAVIDLMADPPIIQVPRSVLTSGKFTYEVVLSNGAGDTARSTDNGYSSAVIAQYDTTYKVSSALFDAESGKLALTTSGLATTGKVTPSRIRLVKGNQQLVLTDEDVDVVSVASTSVVLQLNALASQVDADRFNGTVTLQVDDAWYTSADGAKVAKASETATLKPLAQIERAELEVGTRKLSLYGIGLKQGTPILDRIHIENGTDAVALRPSETISSNTDTLLVLTLSQATFDALTALGGSQYITADAGWIKVTSGSATYGAPALTGTSRRVQVKVNVNGGSYDVATNTLTLRGSGFTGVELHPDKLAFRPSGATRTWRPTSGWTVTVVDNTTIKIEWSAADATLFESTTWFSGRTVYMNTDDGWLLDTAGREAAPLGKDLIKFTVAR